MKVANERESRRAWWIRVRVRVRVLEEVVEEERKEKDKRDGDCEEDVRHDQHVIELKIRLLAPNSNELTYGAQFIVVPRPATYGNYIWS